MASTVGSKIVKASAVAFCALSVAYAGNASAQGHSVGIELATQLPPFDGEAELDNREINGRDIAGGYDEDVESNFGIAFHYLFDLSPGFWLGPRGMLMTGEGDRSNAEYNSFDLSVFMRYVWDPGKVLPFVQGGGGLTFMNDDKHDRDGLGWHISGGGGCGFPVSDSVALYAGLLLHRQAVRVEDDVAGGDLEADLVVFRWLTTFGIGF